jgi:hypothetical protein
MPTLTSTTSRSSFESRPPLVRSNHTWNGSYASSSGSSRESIQFFLFLFPLWAVFYLPEEGGRASFYFLVGLSSIFPLSIFLPFCPFLLLPLLRYSILGPRGLIMNADIEELLDGP